MVASTGPSQPGNDVHSEAVAEPELWALAATGDRVPDKQHRADGEGRGARGRSPESGSPLLPCRLTGCIIIPVEPKKLVVFIVLQITELRPGGLEGLTSHTNSD